MIVRPRPSLLSLFFIIRGSIIHRVFPQILLTACLSALIVLIHKIWPGVLPVFSGAPFALLGIALSIFLAFRNNACYDRWWEARRQWGQLVTSARHFARQTLIVAESGAEGVAERRQLLLLLAGFIQSLVPHLRGGVSRQKACSLLPEEMHAVFEESRNPPEAITAALQLRLTALHARGVIGDITLQMMDRTIADLTAAQAACERIRWTPVPFGYTLLLHRTAHLFCLLLPFGFDDVLGWFMPFATALVAYTFFGLDALGDELEDPFGRQSNALPIEAMADMIEINLREAMGEKDLPPLPVPVDYLLM